MNYQTKKATWLVWAVGILVLGFWRKFFSKHAIDVALGSLFVGGGDVIVGSGHGGGHKVLFTMWWSGCGRGVGGSVLYILDSMLWSHF